MADGQEFLTQWALHNLHHENAMDILIPHDTEIENVSTYLSYHFFLYANNISS